VDNIVEEGFYEYSIFNTLEQAITLLLSYTLETDPT